MPVVARGKLEADFTTEEQGSGLITEPTGAGDVVLWDSDLHTVVDGRVVGASTTSAALPAGHPAIKGGGDRFRRLLLALKSNVDGTIHVRRSTDWANWDFDATQAYTAATPDTGLLTFVTDAPRVHVSFQTAGAVATWRFALLADESIAS
jgi:hypothetical protein